MSSPAGSSVSRRKTSSSNSGQFLTVKPTPPTRLSRTPSWIGPIPPPRPITPGAPIMKSTVKLSYSSAGLQAPVFVITSLSQPGWEPIEMHYSKKTDGELEFYKEFEAEDGEYQYKYRLGPGDWWVLDENKPTVDDGSGNRNNTLTVKAPEPIAQKPAEQPKDAEQLNKTEIKPENSQEAGVMAKETAARIFAAPSPDQTHNEELDTHVIDHTAAHVQNSEQARKAQDSSAKISQSKETPDKHEDPVLDAYDGDDVFTTEDNAPLFRHETTFGGKTDPTLNEEYADIDDVEEERAESGAPLFRHETMKVGAKEEEHAPLFRHETNLVGATSKPEVKAESSPTSRLDSITSNVEKFPTDQAEIMQHVRRASTRLPEDEVAVEGTPPSPSMLSRRGSGAASGSQSLHRSSSAASELSNPQLDSINETEEDRLSAHKTDAREVLLDSVMAAAILQHGPESSANKQTHEDHEESQRKHQHHHHHNQKTRVNSGPTEPLTPPMTPVVNDTEETVDGRFASFESTLARSTSDTPRKRSDYSTDNTSAKVSTASTPNESPVIPSKQELGFLALIKGFIFGLGEWLTSMCGGRGRATGIIAVAVGIAAAAYKFRDIRQNTAVESMA